MAVKIPIFFVPLFFILRTFSLIYIGVAATCVNYIDPRRWV